MLDDTSKQASDERPRINVHKESDLKYWADRFGVSHEKLRQTVATVGSTVEAVKEHLGK